MHTFKKGDVVMVGEKGSVAWYGRWPRGVVGVVGRRSPYPETPWIVEMGPDAAEYISYFAPDELHYIGRL